MQACWPSTNEIDLMYEKINQGNKVQLKEVIARQDKYIRQCNDQLSSLRTWKATQVNQEK